MSTYKWKKADVQFSAPTYFSKKPNLMTVFRIINNVENL